VLLFQRLLLQLPLVLVLLPLLEVPHLILLHYLRVIRLIGHQFEAKHLRYELLPLEIRL
jgi:hypothetical protein